MKYFLKFLLVLMTGAAVFFLFLVKKQTVPERVNPGKSVQTLGYLTWVPAAETIHKKGVTGYNRDESFAGYNLYSSREQASAILMDMNGRAVHRWQSPPEIRGSWHHVEICPDGGLLAIIKDRALIKLDWDSRLKWQRRYRFHHDLAVEDTGDIYAIASREQFVFHNGWPFPVVLDTILHLSPQGEPSGELPVYARVADRIPGGHYRRIYRWLSRWNHRKAPSDRKERTDYLLPSGKPPDILHTNSLEIIARDIPGICVAGDFLISFRELDMIGILDRGSGGLKWSWGPGILEKQHQPVMLENGNILVFDNGNRERRYSRVLEMSPATGKVVWVYQAQPPGDFFSLSRGGNQRLPNGNTLITESDRGRVFEVDGSGKIVWEFYNPRVNRVKKTRAAIYRMTRLWDRNRYPFLKKLDGF